MSNREMRRFLSILALLVLAAGCGDDDDDEESLSATFVADGPAGEGDVALAAAGSPDGHLVVSVVLGGGFTNVYGAAFRLDYDTTVIEFAAVEAGSALTPDGADAFTMARQSAAGQLVFGASRADTFDGVDPAAGAVVARLSFRPVGKGTTRLDFADERRMVADERLDEIEVAHWIGGEVTVR